MIYSIQYIRAFAAILVVATHVFSLINELEPIKSEVNIFRDVNIAFTFAAGFLFQNLSISENYKNFISRKIKNVIIPYIFLSVPAILIYCLGIKQHPNLDLSQINGYLLPFYLLVTGVHLGPLWFVPMIFIIYLSTPMLRMFDKFQDNYLLAFIASLVVSVLIFNRPENNDQPLVAAMHYLPVFILGMCFSKSYENIRGAAKIIKLSSLPLAVLVVYISVGVTENVNFVLKIISLGFFFLFFVSIESHRSKVVDILAKNSFGIFFIHGYVIAAIRFLPNRESLASSGKLLAVLSITCLIIILCLVSIYATKKMLGKRSRYLIGA